MTKEKVSELDNEIALLCHDKAKWILSQPNITDEQFDYAFELIKLYGTYITYDKVKKTIEVPTKTIRYGYFVVRNDENVEEKVEELKAHINKLYENVTILDIETQYSTNFQYLAEGKVTFESN